MSYIRSDNSGPRQNKPAVRCACTAKSHRRRHQTLFADCRDTFVIRESAVSVFICIFRPRPVLYTLSELIPYLAENI